MTESANSAADVGLIYFMATSGGPHPASMWAEKTAAQIVQIKPGANYGAQFRLRLVELLEGFHAHVQEEERKYLCILGDDRLTHSLDPTPYIRPAMTAIFDTAERTQFAQHFTQPHVRDYLFRLLGDHFATSMQIERQWYIARKGS